MKVTVGLLSYTANRENRVDLLLEKLKALGDRQRQHPPNQRQVDTVFAVVDCRGLAWIRHFWQHRCFRHRLIIPLTWLPKIS